MSNVLVGHADALWTGRIRSPFMSAVCLRFASGRTNTRHPFSHRRHRGVRAPCTHGGKRPPGSASGLVGARVDRCSRCRNPRSLQHGWTAYPGHNHERPEHEREDHALSGPRREMRLLRETGFSLRRRSRSVEPGFARSISPRDSCSRSGSTHLANATSRRCRSQ